MKKNTNNNQVDDMSELIEFLNEKFDDAKNQLVDVRQEIHLTNQKLDNKLDTEEFITQFNELHTSLDAYAGKADSYFQEMLMISHQMKRYDKWFEQIAKKLDMKLEY